MRTTLSLIKADVGSIGGHVAPSQHLIQTVRAYVAEACSDHLISDYYVLTAGDDIGLLMAHERGASDPEVHRLAWDAFHAGARESRTVNAKAGFPDALRATCKA